MITSTQNQRIKHLLLLQQKSAQRRADGLFVVEGRREVEHCLEAGFTLRTAFVCEEIDEAPLSLPQDVEVVPVSRNVYERIAYRGGTEGIVAVVEVRKAELTDLKLSSSPLIVVLESVEKPGNLGAVLRSADAAGADAVGLQYRRMHLFLQGERHTDTDCTTAGFEALLRYPDDWSDCHRDGNRSDRIDQSMA